MSAAESAFAAAHFTHLLVAFGRTKDATVQQAMLSDSEYFFIIITIITIIIIIITITIITIGIIIVALVLVVVIVTSSIESSPFSDEDLSLPICPPTPTVLSSVWPSQFTTFFALCLQLSSETTL